MGCCQSDLKGDSNTGVDDPAPVPVKKTATNFSTIDYDSNATGRRDTVYAPDEELRQKSEQLSPLTEKKSDPIANAGIDSTVASAGPTQTTTSDSIQFENRITDPHAAAVDEAPKAAYQDVTASPTVNTTTNPLDSHLPPTKQEVEKTQPTN